MVCLSLTSDQVEALMEEYRHVGWIISFLIYMYVSLLVGGYTTFDFTSLEGLQVKRIYSTSIVLLYYLLVRAVHIGCKKSP